MLSCQDRQAPVLGRRTDRQDREERQAETTTDDPHLYQGRLVVQDQAEPSCPIEMLGRIVRSRPAGWLIVVAALTQDAEIEPYLTDRILAVTGPEGSQRRGISRVRAVDHGSRQAVGHSVTSAGGRSAGTVPYGMSGSIPTRRWPADRWGSRTMRLPPSRVDATACRCLPAPATPAQAMCPGGDEALRSAEGRRRRAIVGRSYACGASQAANCCQAAWLGQDRCGRPAAPFRRRRR